MNSGRIYLYYSCKYEMKFRLKDMDWPNFSFHPDFSGLVCPTQYYCFWLHTYYLQCQIKFIFSKTRQRDFGRSGPSETGKRIKLFHIPHDALIYKCSIPYSQATFQNGGFPSRIHKHTAATKGRVFSEIMMQFSHCPKNVPETILNKRF